MCAFIIGTKNYFPDKEKKIKKIYEYVDRLIQTFPDFDYFHIHSYYKIIEPQAEERRKLTSLSGEIRTVMQKLGYIENPPEGNAVYVLTEKGRAAKKKGGHYKYIKSLEPKTDWLKIIPIILTIIFSTTSSIFLYKNYHLNDKNAQTALENETLKKENDSLKLLLKVTRGSIKR